MVDADAASDISQPSMAPSPGPIDNRALGDERELREGMVRVS